MRKAVAVIAGVVVLVGAGWTAASWYTGKQVQQEVEQYVQTLNSRPGVGSVAIENYQRGIFSSSARYRFTVGPVSLPLDVVRPGEEVVFDGKIHHGPWPWSRVRTGALKPVLAATHTKLEETPPVSIWFDAAGGSTPFEEHSVFHYDGSVDFTARFAQLLLESPDFLLKSDGGSVQGHATDEGRALQIDGSFGEVRLHAGVSPDFEEGPFELYLKGISLSAQSGQGRFGLYPGTAQVGIDEIHVNTQDEAGQPVEVVLENYRITGALMEDDTHVHGSVKYEVGQIVAEEVPLGSLALDLKVNRLDGKVVQDILQRYQAALPQILEQEQQAQQANDIPPALAAWLAESVQALLPGEPVLSIDEFRWTLNDAVSRLRVNIALQAPTRNTQPPLMASIKQLTAELVLSRDMVVELMTRLEQLSGEAPTSSLEQARASAQLSFAFLQQLALSSGYATVEEGNLVARLQYNEEGATLNGQDIPLEELLELVPSE